MQVDTDPVTQQQVAAAFRSLLLLSAGHCTTSPGYYLQVQIWYSDTFLGVNNKSNVAAAFTQMINVGVCVRITDRF